MGEKKGERLKNKKKEWDSERKKDIDRGREIDRREKSLIQEKERNRVLSEKRAMKKYVVVVWTLVLANECVIRTAGSSLI